MVRANNSYQCVGLLGKEVVMTQLAAPSAKTALALIEDIWSREFKGSVGVIYIGRGRFGENEIEAVLKAERAE